MAQPKKWVDEIVDVLSELGGEATYDEIYNLIGKRGIMNLTKRWKNSVRKTIEDNSSDSDNYYYSNGKDIFYSVHGKGKGVWGLRESNPVNNSHITPTEELLMMIQSDSNDDQEQVTRRLREINQLNRNRILVNSLKKLYRNECQICNTQIQIDETTFYSEVHHLKPLGRPHNGEDIIENMIVVCPNCHVKLDYNAMRIELEEINIKAPHKISTEYINYQNSKIHQDDYRNDYDM